MFSRSILVAFLSLALSVQAIPKNNNNNAQCSSIQTVVHTVTVTARGTAPTGNQLINSKGSNGSKTTAAQATATAKSNNNGGKNSNPQTSTTLDPGVIATGFENNGQDVPEAGQVASLTSSNNFINFCLTVPNLPITNGKQITTGSCNPAPIGVIPSTDNMPSAKFSFPTNFGTIKANTNFTIEMNIQNLETGHFVNAQENYFSAPQQLNAQGQIQGHSHVVVEQLTSLTDTTPTDPRKFAFFKGLNAAAVGGKLTAAVPNGLAVGVYKLSSINTAANHQPAIVPIAQHGSLDDAIYFTVTADGKAPVANGANGAKVATPVALQNGANGAKVASPVALQNGANGAKVASPVALQNGANGAKVASPVALQNGANGAKVATPVALQNGASGAKVASPVALQNGAAGAQKVAGKRRFLNRQA
jgi:hypothetical protein